MMASKLLLKTITAHPRPNSFDPAYHTVMMDRHLPHSVRVLESIMQWHILGAGAIGLLWAGKLHKAGHQ
ncbi:2-dehydropantoate 2-reductase N-terminal domain-containing protein, partial [Gilvimarinus sp. SDUM040013]|uniref:2-dehydropantoate 2-reductase N-terminal domain-containing protein n=1 Tax=Gilvimarinus gilvus TaxID=3058038 RepID=UPI002670FF0E